MFRGAHGRLHLIGTIGRRGASMPSLPAETVWSRLSRAIEPYATVDCAGFHLTVRHEIVTAGHACAVLSTARFLLVLRASC
jgi:hypothetical protein